MGIRISEMEEATTFGADDYVPIVTNGTNKKALGAKIKDFIAGFFVSKSGDTMTGDLIIEKRSGKIYHKTPNMTVDTSANNGLTQNSFHDFGTVDSNNYLYAWAESGASTYGFNTMALGVRNKDTNGNVITNSLTFRVNKDGTVKTTVDQPQEFRSAIGIEDYNSYNAWQKTTAVSVPSMTHTTLISDITLSAGVWCIAAIAEWAYDNNTSGVRRIYLTNSSTSTTPLSYMRDTRVTGTDPNHSALSNNFAMIVNLTASTTLYLRALQTSGSAVSVNSARVAVARII